MMSYAHIRVFIIVLLTIMAVGEGLEAEKKKNKRPQKFSGKCKPKIMAEYELAFHSAWTESVYPRMYPTYRPHAQWSKLIGRSHSTQYTMWSEGAAATEAVREFAEGGDTRGFDIEAQAYGGIRDAFTAAPISGGMGKTATNFIADGEHSLVSFMVRLIPSPDWFVGIASFDLCESGRWKSHIKVDLFPLDAGTDRGLTFTAPDWPSVPREAIYRLSPMKPAHSASAFYYPNMTSLPSIGKVFLTKVAEFRRSGKVPPPVKQEQNLEIINDESELPAANDKVIDTTFDGIKDITVNEIEQPRAESLIAPSDTGCVVSEWSPWSECSVTCGFGRQDRRRSILRRALSPGLYCPVLREDRTCGTMRTCEWEVFQFLNRNG
ncbi:spondin-2-like [Dreissena polymorpha]|uniref:Spondin domain-containing protein n=1 Tax=Dreissena polymorpha TaxID=45954 RepID=A0A9D4IXB2_DREPO|nr:spondin-2-like [Dreissena polymorpha]KAH3787653.1 hypothetical protein DPMN_165780 [Dreissena polymorpha]